MSGYRPIYKKIWKDPDFQELEPIDKLIFIYLCTNDATTESGIYPLTTRTLANETGIELSTVCERLKNGFFKNVFYDDENKLIFVRKLRKYNTGGRPEYVRTSIRNDYHNYSTTPLWRYFVEEYRNDEHIGEVCNGLQTVQQPLLTLTLNHIDIDKNKESYGEFKNVMLLESEYQKLIELHGEKQSNVMIESLSAYLKTKKKRYADHYATLRNWFRRDEKDGKVIRSQNAKVIR